MCIICLSKQNRNPTKYHILNVQRHLRFENRLEHISTDAKYEANTRFKSEENRFLKFLIILLRNKFISYVGFPFIFQIGIGPSHIYTFLDDSLKFL